MQGRFKLLFLLSVVLFGCSTHLKDSINEQKALDICDLPEYQDKKTRLIATYSGVDEYWSLNSVRQKKCSNDFTIDLDFDDNYDLPNHFRNLMRKVHSSYWNTYLLIDAIGIYETGKKGGYGHLGYNKARFRIVKVLDMKLIKKKK
ncbi:hypothetical protein [Pedobacter chitinilyticus]|uniref:Lipoprotein n=1 Tax=Pedobacter chitinilyticus TaxID=2233776 RepID=A0A3S3R4S8_9SPHI|nr:hypothetical protein [Pedobacter chitinilyticus]RWU05026.1 hypothetical protein DPV69_17845 [Pedobacter chitinilyticus]